MQVHSLPHVSGSSISDVLQAVVENVNLMTSSHGFMLYNCVIKWLHIMFSVLTFYRSPSIIPYIHHSSFS